MHIHFKVMQWVSCCLWINEIYKKYKILEKLKKIQFIIKNLDKILVKVKTLKQ